MIPSEIEPVRDASARRKGVRFAAMLVVETLVLGEVVFVSWTSRTFLRCNRRVKDGKVHEYWNVVENRRLSDGRIVQRQVPYLGEINSSQREAWRKMIEVHGEGTRGQIALFPAGSMPARWRTRSTERR
ncbi:MAG: hypothetical protein WAO95_09385 [Burkholderiales bacterium]